MNKTITVFTPTYNRAYCLPLLYESLLRQSLKDFLWLVVDDGSSDNTKSLVQSWIDDGAIEIEYVYKENGGMHTGHNKAFENIETELAMCIDSDDYVPDAGIEDILKLWKQYGSEKYGGMIGLDIFSSNGNVVGAKFPDGLTECKYGELEYKYKAWGDKKVVYRTEAAKKVKPYPVFEGEKFVTLYMALVIDQTQKFLCFNEVFCVVDYQADGSTINIFNQYFKNPKGFSHARTIEMKFRTPFILRFRSAIHYVFTSILSKNYNFLKESPKKIMTFFAIPFGVVLYFYLSFQRNKQRDISKYVK